MNKLRVVHRVMAPEGDTSPLSAYAADLRSVDGLVEAEAYTALDDGTKGALIELWESEAAYAVHWRDVLAGKWSSPLLAAGVDDLAHATEFYAHQPFVPDRIWKAAIYAETGPVVIWPARGAVRIVIQLAVPEPDAMVGHFTQDVAATRREPGCSHYAWYQGTEFAAGPAPPRTVGQPGDLRPPLEPADQDGQRGQWNA